MVALTVVAYLPALPGGFIWDDEDHLTQNPAVQSVGGLKQIWSSLETSRYYPLTLTTFWVQYRLWGLYAPAYHAVNIVLQAANALLLWTLLRRLHVRGAWLAAAVWAVHPVNAETVAWITELKNTQSGLFFVLALLLLVRFEDGRQRRDYVWALVCAAAAMLSKPSTVLLPAVALLCGWWRRGRLTRTDWLRVLPLLAMAAAMSLLTIVEQRQHIAGEGTPDWTLTAAQRLVLAGRAVWFYAGKLLWPVNVCFIYPRWELRTDTVVAWLPLAALIAVAVALWFFRRERWAQAALFGGGCFVLALLPVLGFFDVYFFRYSYVADHFQYLASAALIALVVSGLACWIKQPVAGRLVAGVVIALLVGLTWRQSYTFGDSERLYLATIARNPAAWMAHNNLGALYLERNQPEKALAHFEIVLKYRSSDAGVFNNLGTALFRLGRAAEALASYQRAAELKPDYPEAHYNLANALVEFGRLDEAVTHYTQALQLKPHYADAHYNLANTLVRQGRLDEAVAHYEQAVRLAPHDADMRATLAGMLAQQGRLDEAAEHYQQAIRLRPEFATAHFNLANILLQLGNATEAVGHYRVAAMLNPESLPVQFNLATALLHINRPEEAISRYQQVLATNPELATAHYGLAVAWAQLGDFDRATNACARAVQLGGELPQALADCAWLLATHDSATADDIARAVDWAMRACRLTADSDPAFLDALAAAHAAAGQFPNAITVATQAVALAAESGNAALQQEILSRLQLYQAGQPYRTKLPTRLPSGW